MIKICVLGFNHCPENDISAILLHYCNCGDFSTLSKKPNSYLNDYALKHNVDTNGVRLVLNGDNDLRSKKIFLPWSYNAVFKKKPRHDLKVILEKIALAFQKTVYCINEKGKLIVTNVKVDGVVKGQVLRENFENIDKLYFVEFTTFKKTRYCKKIS